MITPVNIYRCKIGNHVRIGPFVEIQSDSVIGDGCVIGSHSFIASGTKIGSNAFIGHGVVTCNDRHPVPNNPQFKCEPPIIEDSASIGSGAIILPGVRIGSGAVVGAGAIVVRDVPAGGMAVGTYKGPCVYEARTKYSENARHGYSESAVWCKTHGWDCPINGGGELV